MNAQSEKAGAGKSGMRDSGMISDHPVSPQLERTSSLAWWIGMALVILFFLVLKMFTLNPYASDEYIYIYQGKLIAEGLVPYKDFSMAHPPLQALFTAGLIKVFGYDFLVFRMLGTFWALLAGIVLGFVVKREWGSVAAVSSSALYLLAYEPLRASIHFTGVNMTIALLMLTLLAFRRKNMMACSLFGAMAVFTRLYALPAMLALFIVHFVNDRKGALRLAAYGFGIGAVFFILLGAWSGFNAMMNDILLFQAQKTAMQEDRLSFMRDAVLFHNAVPFILFIVGAATLIAMYFNEAAGTAASGKREKKKGRLKKDYSLLWTAFLSVLLILGILLNMDRVWMYYFVLAFPFAAILGGWMISNWVQNRKAVFLMGKTEGAVTSLRPVWWTGTLVVFVAFYFISPRLEKRLDYYRQAMRDPAKRTANYTWHDGKLPSGVNQLVKSLFWQDTRIIGETYSSFTYYLWHCSRIIDIAFEIAEEIRQRAKEGDRIFGDSGTVPLMALLTGLNIAGNEVDTNVERYRSGNADPRTLIQKIEVPSTRFLLLRDKFGVSVLPEIQNLLGRNYREVKSWKSKTGFTIRLFERR
ncbi:MAG: hypothetical protein JNL88_03310 [Bacteroidia bacterium]|nr:hypothetical protein [Bacteroidia bacterium]